MVHDSHLYVMEDEVAVFYHEESGRNRIGLEPLVCL
jgi:hypothetical protein